MIQNRLTTAQAAVELIRDGDTVGLIGGGGLLEASCLFAAIERRFLSTGSPRALTLVHALGIGDRKTQCPWPHGRRPGDTLRADHHAVEPLHRLNGGTA